MTETVVVSKTMANVRLKGILIYFDADSSLKSIDKGILVQHLERPIWWSRQNDPCQVKIGILIRMLLITMGFSLELEALIGIGE